MPAINNLTVHEVKWLQVLAIKNEERLHRIIEEITPDEPKAIKKIFKDELKANKLLSAKLRINLY